MKNYDSCVTVLTINVLVGDADRGPGTITSHTRYHQQLCYTLGHLHCEGGIGGARYIFDSF